MITVVVLLGALGVGCSSTGNAPRANTTPAGQRTYSTMFPPVENPIIESGSWGGGQSAGGDLWGNVQTNGNMAFEVSEPTESGDARQILAGTVGPRQLTCRTRTTNMTPRTCSPQ